MPEVLHETPGIFPPSIPPRKQRTKVVQPIMRHEGRSETPSMKAKDMPTARASRLVATAMTSSCEWRSCVHTADSPPFIASTSILTPTKASRKKLM